MALIEKLNAIGEAIRTKTGKTEKMTLDEMPVEIASIEGGGGAPANPVIEALSVTENGTYNAPEGVDGYSPVSVNVPIPEGYIQPTGTKTITENGKHDVETFKEVEVNVPIPEGYIIPSGTKNITENGEHDVTEFAKVNVNVPTSGGGGGSSELPAGYRRADYIQFNGENFIDTGVKGNQDTQINLAFTWESTTQRHVFGCLSSGNTTGITSYMNGSWRFGDKSSSKNFNLKEPKLPYSALVNKSKISTITSNSNISGVADFETIGTLLVGGARSADGSVPTAGIIGKVFYFNLWQNEILTRKLVPVTDGSTYRFFDMVSKEFFDSITDVPLEGGDF